MSLFAKLDDAIVWIAENDEPLERDVNTIAEQISVLLVADIFSVNPEVVAKRVLRLREVSP